MRHDSTTADVLNIAAYLPAMARQVPDQAAVVVTTGYDRGGRARYTQLTFRELEEQSNRYANGLSGVGIGRGTRTLVMVRPGREFVGLIFALFKMGAVPILIDPGMGLRRMLECIRGVRPEAFVGIPLAQVMRLLRPGPFGRVRHIVTVGRRWFWGGPTLRGLGRSASCDFEPAPTKTDEPAAILFTSGSTGPPKGVIYTHGMFDAQVRAIREHYGIQSGEVDLPTFLLFALFGPAMSLTCVIPDMDPSRPAQVDPARIVTAIRDHAVTNTFGSPALWEQVSRYCVERGITLPTLRRVLIAGAPVRWPLIERMHRVLVPPADMHTPYGATEALPVASISGREVLADCRERSRTGAGTCVGRPLEGVTVRIIRITDEPIAAWSDDLAVPDGEIGEIVVRGDVVTQEYAGLPEATAAAKIAVSDQPKRQVHDLPYGYGARDSGLSGNPQCVWHRMGDVGYLDDQGRLWFCGRKAHRVTTAHGTLYTEPCEAIFNEHPDVYRSALVGVGPPGQQEPVIVVEPVPGKFPSGLRMPDFWEELLELGRAHELTRGIDVVLFHRAFPVDVRHNAKIDRDALAVWAAGQLR